MSFVCDECYTYVISILNWIFYFQVNVYKTAKKVPVELQKELTMETFDKARLYGLDKSQFSIVKSVLLEVILVPLELYFGVLSMMWYKSQELAAQLNLNPDSEIQTSCVLILVLTVVSLVKEMPFTIYGVFVLEEKHGFNKQTAGFFILDQLKSLALSIALTLPIASAVIYIVQIGGQYFFVWLWLFVGIVTLLFVTIYPVFIAPLFDTYRPLDDGPLRKSIEELSANLRFPLKQLYVVEGSKRSAHSNAYFYGLWGSKRIVLFDTLLINKGKPIEENAAGVEKEAEDKDVSEKEKLLPAKDNKGCEDSEVLAVLAHELGHWQLGHVTKNIIISQVHLFLMFFAFGYLFHFDPVYRAVGFKDGEKPILVGLILIFTYLFGAYNSLITFAMTVLSRKFEYQADEFAQKLGYSDELCKALIKLNIDNLGFPVYDWMYSSWSHSHPTLLQRMDRLKQNKKTN